MINSEDWDHIILWDQDQPGDWINRISEIQEHTEDDLVGVIVSRMIDIVTKRRQHQREDIITVQLARQFRQYYQRVCLKHNNNRPGTCGFDQPLLSSWYWPMCTGANNQVSCISMAVCTSLYQLLTQGWQNPHIPDCGCESMTTWVVHSTNYHTLLSLNKSNGKMFLTDGKSLPSNIFNYKSLESSKLSELCNDWWVLSYRLERRQ